MKKYGKVLMAEVPQKTTQLLKRLCTEYKPSNREYLKIHYRFYVKIFKIKKHKGCIFFFF